MEIYKSNKNNKKIYEKINYVKLLLILLICSIILTIVFYYIGGERDILNSIQSSLKISFLLSIASIIGDLIESRNRVFIIDKEEIGFLDIHTEKVGGPYLKDREFFDVLNKNDIEDVYYNNYKFEGIDKSIIKNIISIKKKYNRIVLKVNVLTKEWKSSSAYTISRLCIVEKERIKKIVIPNDYDNYEKLYKKLLKKNEI